MLHVENLTQNQVLIAYGRVADTFWTRLKGLIGVRQLLHGDGLLITRCNSVHCMFMSIPIDVIYADRDNRIVALDRNMKPWALGRIHWKAHDVLELPIGAIDRTNTTVGDQLLVRLTA